MKLLVALGVTLLVSAAWCAPATQQTKQSSRATLDFIAHEQASGAAEVAPAPTTQRPRPPATTTQRPRFPSAASDTQQHLHQHQQRANASSTPKKDWELVPPHQERPTPLPARPATTARPVPRPTPPTYAGVVKDQRHGGQSQDRATTPRVYNIPISVEPGYTTSTEASHWYDKLFGKSVDADDSPWGRRRRQVAAGPGQPRQEIVIGSNAIRVAATRPPTRNQQRPARPAA